MYPSGGNIQASGQPPQGGFNSSPYPPQQGGQGYPPQGQSCPPQQHHSYAGPQGQQQGYPPQQGGQGYPPQGYPPQQSQGYGGAQGQGYPPQQGGLGYPPQQNQGYGAPVPQGQQQQGYPPQGAQGYPPQGQGYPPQQNQGYGTPVQQQPGYPPQQSGQGYPPQGSYPPQQNQAYGSPGPQAQQQAYYPPPSGPPPAAAKGSGRENRYWLHYNTGAGLMTSLSRKNSSSGPSRQQHTSFEVELFGVEEHFGSKHQPWNTSYAQAQKIFGSSVKSNAIRAAVHSQHKALYREGSEARTRQASLHSGEDLLQLIEFGQRGGVPQIYTYVIVGNRWRFCETGASFLKDMFSKHAMHADCAREVRYSGEFHVIQSAKQPGKWMLVLDNNSGTYGPDKDDLAKLQALFQSNFPDIITECYDFRDERLKASLARLGK